MSALPEGVHVVSGTRIRCCETGETDCPCTCHDRPAPEVVHACPPDGSGLTPCCRRPPFELPHSDRMTGDPDAVTCANPGL